MKEGTIKLTPLRCSQSPIATASGICIMQGKMAAGYSFKTTAITNPKIASTIVRANGLAAIAHGNHQ